MTHRFHRYNKIFGIGLPRTGTTLLSKALSTLGISSCRQYLNFEEMAYFKAICHETVAAWFKTWDYLFPDSKFILTVRDQKSWLKSIFHMKDTLGYFPSEFHPSGVTRSLSVENSSLIANRSFLMALESLFGGWIGCLSKKDFIRGYESHTKRVLTYFQNRPQDILVLDIALEKSWDKICSFLELDVPSTPFPQTGERVYSTTKKIQVPKQELGFVTVCHNYGFLAQKSFVSNLELFLADGHVKWIFVDYGSSDGITAWAWQQPIVWKAVQKQVLTWLEVPEAKYYVGGHSRNVGAAFLNTPIMGNLDVDHVASADYLREIRYQLGRMRMAQTQVNWKSPNGIWAGRMAFYREDFVAVGGYDENFCLWGGEDLDLVSRLTRLGCKRVVLPRSANWGLAEKHSSDIRSKNANHALIRFIGMEDNNASFIKNCHFWQKEIGILRDIGGLVVANWGKNWGAAKIRVNRGELVDFPGVSTKETADYSKLGVWGEN